MVVSRDLLAQVGRSLYGNFFSRHMAADIDVNERTMRRWLTGDLEVPDGVAAELIELVDERRHELDKLALRLAGAGREW